MIQLTDLHKIYHQPGREVVALDGVSLEVKPGEIFGVLGQSGAGKSTLIRCVNLLERPTSGSVKVQDITANPNHLEIEELEAAQLPRALDAAAIAVINMNYALEANLKPKTGASVELAPG